MTAGVDAREGFQSHVYVASHAVIRAPLAPAQPGREGSLSHANAIYITIDLEPCSCINPYGNQGLRRTQTSTLGGPQTVAQMSAELLPQLLQHLGYR